MPGKTSKALPPKEKIIRISASDVPNIDPGVGIDYVSATAACNIYDTLVFPNPDGSIKPWVATDWSELTTIVSKHKYPAWGFAGGKDGSLNVVEIHYGDGSEPLRGATFSNYVMHKGDLVRFISGTGGGYGNPLERPAEKVLQDAKDEFITLEIAERDYGVVIDPETREINQDLTRQLRSEKTNN